MENGIRVGKFGRMTESEKQLFYAHSDIVQRVKKHREIMNENHDYSKGFQAGLELAEDLLFDRTRKILHL